MVTLPICDRGKYYCGIRIELPNMPYSLMTHLSWYHNRTCKYAQFVTHLLWYQNRFLKYALSVVTRLSWYQNRTSQYALCCADIFIVEPEYKLQLCSIHGDTCIVVSQQSLQICCILYSVLTHLSWCHNWTLKYALFFGDIFIVLSG